MIVNFFRPYSAEAASQLLSGHDAAVLAGGTDLAVELRSGKFEHQAIVDITEISELKEIQMADDGSVFIGATASFSEVVENPLVSKHVPLLRDACVTVGSPQIRNRGTIGGNIMNGSPAADSVPALFALKARAVVYRGGKKIEMSLDELLSERKLAKEDGGFLYGLTVPVLTPGTRWAFVKLGRRNALSISRMNISVLVQTGECEKITEARVVLGAVGRKPVVAAEAEKVLVGMGADADYLPFVEALSRQIVESLGTRSTVGYKREAVKGIGAEAYSLLWTNRVN